MRLQFKIEALSGLAYDNMIQFEFGDEMMSSCLILELERSSSSNSIDWLFTGASNVSVTKQSERK
jgi:hypothetical protein